MAMGHGFKHGLIDGNNVDIYIYVDIMISSHFDFWQQNMFKPTFVCFCWSLHVIVTLIRHSRLSFFVVNIPVFLDEFLHPFPAK